MKVKFYNKKYDVGDVLIIRDDSGYYSSHPHRYPVKGLEKSDKIPGEFFGIQDPFPTDKKVTVIGFQTLNTNDICLIVRYNKKAYWISIKSLRQSNKLKQKVVEIVEKTNPRRKKDIIKRYWEEL